MANEFDLSREEMDELQEYLKVAFEMAAMEQPAIYKLGMADVIRLLRAVVIIIVICLIVLLADSCFGIFFFGEDSGTGQIMQTAVREINTDYQDKLDEIKNSVSYYVLEMSGSRAVWKEVL